MGDWTNGYAKLMGCKLGKCKDDREMGSLINGQA